MTRCLLAMAALTLAQAAPVVDPGLTRTLERLAAKSPGTAGISVVHIESGRSASVNAGVRFPMMSHRACRL